MIKRLSAWFLFLCLLSFASAGRAEKSDEGVTRFLFIGHIRGYDNFKVNPLVPHFVREAKNLKKDFVLVSGDIICGYQIGRAHV